MAVADRIDTKALLARVDIVDVVGGYVPLTKSGAEYEACCPFHVEKTPSFKVSPAKQIYHCFGCGASGDAIKFLREHVGLSFRDAVRALGGEAVVGAAVHAAPLKAPARVREESPWVPVLPAPADAPEAPRAHPVRGLPEAAWCYRDAAGAVLGWVYRFTRSGGDKETCPLVWARNIKTGQSAWRWMAFSKPRPLYGLDRLAAKPDAVVLIVEGEKCADAAAAALPEFAVVSWPGGSKAVAHADFSPLAGRRVITWADCDAKRDPLTSDEKAAGVDPVSKPILPEAEQPGRMAMDAVAAAVRAVGGRVRDVTIPAPGEVVSGWDVADAIADGVVGDELRAFVLSGLRVPVPAIVPPVPASVPDARQGAECPEEPPTWVYEEIPMSDGAVSSVPACSAAVPPQKLAGKPLLQGMAAWLNDARPFVWVVDGLIQRGCLYAMTAITNHGKTAIGLYLSMCVAGGRNFAGRDVLRGGVLILCGENPDGFRTRLRATLEAMSLPVDEVGDMVTVLPHALPLRGYVEQIKEEASRCGEFALVLVDTSVSYFTGDSEDDNLQARSHAWDLRALSELPGNPAVIANCHPTKSALRESLLPRGGGAFTNEIDTNLTVWADGETAHLHWHQKKRGPDFDPIPFEFHGRQMVEFGQSIPTVVALPISDERAGELRRARNQDEDRLLYAMMHEPDGTFRSWATACGWTGNAGNSGTSKVSRTMERLMGDKLVGKSRHGYKLTKEGKDQAQYIR